MANSRRNLPAMRVLEDMPNKDYHAMDRLSRSDLLRIHRSPLAYRHHKENPLDEKAKPLVIGTAFHTAVLEPDDFAKNYEMLPEEIEGKGPRTAHYKEALEKMRWERPNRKWLPPDDYELVLRLAESALSHPVLRECLAKPHKVEGTAKFSVWRCRCKCRPDLTIFRGGRKVDVLDLKSCQDASPDGFAKAAANWGYDVQAEFYRKGLEANGLTVGKFIFLAVEKTAPYLSGAHVLHSDDLTTARSIIREACATYVDCKTRDVWPGYGEGIHKLRLPAWRSGSGRKALTVASIDSNFLTVKQIAKSFSLTVMSVYRILNRILVIERMKFQGRILVNVDSWNTHWVLAQVKRNGKPSITRTTSESRNVRTITHEDNQNDERKTTEAIPD